MSLETVEKVKPKLEFEKIDISFIYGYVNYNLWKDTPLPKESNFNKMWAPIYNINRSIDGFCIQKDLIADKPITIIPKNNSEIRIPAKLSAQILRKRYNDPKKIRDTDGGPGCLTIKISVENSPELNTNTIYDILNLVPRTSSCPKLSVIEGLEEYFNKPKIKELEEYLNNSEKTKNISNFSSIFKLFRSLLYENQECWSELYLPPLEKEKCYENCLIKPNETRKCNRFYPFYDIESKIDPQIPYMLVEGFLPEKFYEKVFINNEDNSQENYTQEIGSLVGRWLNFENRSHVNTDYYSYYQDIDAIIEKDRNAFISRFRDKKTFGVLSSLLTLILKCDYSDNDDAGNAVELTTNAILSYLEFSRTRLHNALWLNKQLDRLVNEVDGKEKTSEILPIKNKLNVLKIKVAKSMNNPISYMWDSVLGQEIPPLKINRNVEKLENDTIKKMELINELIVDKIDTTQISDLSEFVNREK